MSSKRSTKAKRRLQMTLFFLPQRVPEPIISSWGIISFDCSNSHPIIKRPDFGVCHDHKIYILCCQFLFLGSMVLCLIYRIQAFRHIVVNFITSECLWCIDLGFPVKKVDHQLVIPTNCAPELTLLATQAVHYPGKALA